MNFDPMGHETPKGDIEAIVRLACKACPGTATPMTLVEIGSWAGQSTLAIARWMTFRDRLFAVDDWSGMSNSPISPDEAFRTFCHNMGPFLFHNVFPLRGESSFISDCWPDSKPIDFLFIDADHSYEGCRSDIVCWSRYVRDGGIVCGHDYTVGGVRGAVESFFGDKYEISNGNVWSVTVESLP